MGDEKNDESSRIVNIPSQLDAHENASENKFTKKNE